MALPDFAVVILAAGKGTRLKSSLAKVLHRAGGRSLIEHVVRACQPLKPRAIVAVVGHQAEEVSAILKPLAVPTVIQQPQRGTGHAVIVARRALGSRVKYAIVLPGDAPLVRPETLAELARLHRQSGAAATILSAQLADPGGYGRIVRRDDGTVHIVRGSTFDNQNNLSAHMVRELKTRYEGTMIGRQELYGEMVEGFEGALFNRLDLENYRVEDVPDDVKMTVVGVDPSLTGEDDEMGVVVVSRTRDNHMYVLADRSHMAVGRDAALHAWRVVAEFGADLLVYESNLGKRWMQQVFNDAYVELSQQGIFPIGSHAPMKGIDAKVGKKTRGEAVAMRSEQGRLHLVGRNLVLALFTAGRGTICESPSTPVRSINRKPDRGSKSGDSEPTSLRFPEIGFST